MEREIRSVIKYFSLFAYTPTLEEIHMFMSIKISKKKIKAYLDSIKYTPPQYSIKRKISRRKLDNWRYRTYIKILSLFPQIKLVGLSGSISMMNAGLDDDIDLFIITSSGRLFTGRFLVTIFAYIMGLKRGLSQHKAPNKVCLNLFFDESNLKIPKFKQTIFVGHEVLQMKPIIVKGDIYEKFLEANGWVFRLFPNSKERISNFKSISNFKNLGDRLEYQLKKFQLRLINKHRTTELITDSQLWFHPDDFEKKIKF